MKKSLISTAFTIVLFSILFACTQETKTEEETTKVPVKASLNPNGDSELALLMRGMYEEADRIKEQIKNNEEVTVELDHMKILTAHATEPEKAESNEFKAFAQLYLSRLEELKKAEKTEKVALYKSLVESCMSCHQAMCPGPLVRIKKLKL